MVVAANDTEAVAMVVAADEAAVAEATVVVADVVLFSSIVTGQQHRFSN